ncbi:MAG TPA: helix-turn-helix transcriptional regulator [Pseudonocardiaceae bacterium]|nr:helix-turn-helix transcriptional regulator [Pseudonocardiaceae bacterium]
MFFRERASDVDGAELGRRLRAHRTAGGRTIASVATDAGLSVPYIANLENGRGNPTVAALERLAEALGMKLTIDITPPDDVEPDPTPAEPTGDALRFVRSGRFRTEVARLAERAGLPDRAAHQRLIALLAAAQAAAGTELSTLDCQRLVDVLVLANFD